MASSCMHSQRPAGSCSTIPLMIEPAIPVLHVSKSKKNWDHRGPGTKEKMQIRVFMWQNICNFVVAIKKY